MVKVLKKLGCDVSYNTQQTCCGQPAYNAGYREEAKHVATKFLRDFAEDTYIVSPSGSCTGYIRNCYGTLLENTSVRKARKQAQGNVYEFTEFLTKILNVYDLGATLEGKATYHDACGSLRECGIKEGPRKLLANVKGLELVEMAECETCCGFGGTFAIKYEPISIGMAQVKIKSALETEAQYIITTDVSCMMHMQGYIENNNYPIQTMHIADVLAAGW